jgi:hypothetical protein
MTLSELQILTKEIVKQAQILKDKHTNEGPSPVNYACIFSQNENEYQKLMQAVETIGKVIKETPTGNLYQINPIKTSAGLLRLLKIRMPDMTRKGGC